MILNSPMILKSDNFLECLDADIEDVKIYTDHKPLKKVELFSTSAHIDKYVERATGDIKITIKDEKLNRLAQTISKIIKEKK